MSQAVTKFHAAANAAALHRRQHRHAAAFQRVERILQEFQIFHEAQRALLFERLGIGALAGDRPFGEPWTNPARQ